jgi:hypothetical protein
MKAQKQWIKDKMKFSYVNKQKLNQRTYRLHLNLANAWVKLWDLMNTSTAVQLNMVMDKAQKC